MHVLVTRPLEDAKRTASELASRGHKALIAPLLEFRELRGAEPDLDNVQAILATSGNGIRALVRHTDRRDIPIFAVGTQTAAMAREAGFVTVADAAGDAKALAAAVREGMKPDAGALLHVTGGHASLDLGAELVRAGFEIRGCPLYEAVEVARLPHAAAAALQDGALDAVLVYSPRSARLLVDRIRSAGLSTACLRLLACCISRTTADALEGLEFRAVRTAVHPDSGSLMAELAGRN